jgi:hypothetical protein
MEKQKVTIELDLLNATLDYLGKRPFEEVQGLIYALQQQARASFQAQQPGAANEVQPEEADKPKAVKAA